MAKKLHANMITAGDVKKRHPRYLNCETDKQYAELAKEIYDVIYDELDFMDDWQIKNASISLSLYFEDLHSGTHLFETFTKLYKKMFGRYVPFYSSESADSPQAQLDAMKFMLWHAIAAERNGMMLNPTNLGLANMAERLLNLWDERKDKIQPNEELADYLYAEETQDNAYEVKMVLIWLSLYSLLGRWYGNPNPKDDESGLGRLFGQATKETLEYANECHIIFNIQTWPLSLTPQQIYAEMIRIEMDDPNDEIAESIEQIENKPYEMFQIVSNDNMGIKLKDFLGNTFKVDYGDFVGDARKLKKKHSHILASFIKLGKRWELNGPSLWINPSQKHYQMYLDDLQKHHHWMHDYVGQYDWLIDKHHGERLYFFRNAKEYLSWVKDEMGMKDTEMMSSIENHKEPMACFFEYNGQITCCFDAENIKHPDNPSYDKSYAEENSLTFIGGTESCSPDMLLYMLEHNLLPDAMFNDINGRQHGRKLMQENIEFMARCMRRDIKSTKVYHRRTDWNENEGVDTVPIESYRSKLSYDNFVDTINEEDVVLSKARKEWRVVRVDNTKTVIRDVENEKNFEMNTRDLYEAHLHLEENDIQISTVAPYVGKENAPAASALLYNIVGRGQSLNNLRKYTHEIFKYLKLK